MDWILFFFSACALQGLCLSAVFILDRSGGSKRYLGIYLFAFSITILFYVAYWAGMLPDLPGPVRWFGAAASWGMPAAFYLYFRPAARPYVHLSPFLLFTAYWALAASGWLMPEVTSIAGPSLGYLKVLLFLFYGLLVIRGQTLNTFDKQMVFAYFSVAGGLFLYHISLLAGFYTLNFDYFICAVFVLLTYGITYLSQRDFLKRRIGRQYVTSSLTAEEGALIVERIHHLMQEKKSYRDKSFNLRKLGQELKQPTYRISQALNMYSKCSFPDILNEYRIREAREKLQSPSCSHLKVEAIGESVGFSNKVSFYKHFKRLNGMAPGEYQRSL